MFQYIQLGILPYLVIGIYLNNMSLARFTLVFWFVFMGLATHAQDSFLDSLNHLLATNPSDSVRASVYGDLCWHYKYSDAEKALSYGYEAASLAQKHNYNQLLAYAFNNLGIVFWAKSDYDSAAFYIKRTSQLYRALENERGVTVTLTNLGLIFQNQGKYDSALTYQLNALRMVDKIDDKSLKGSILTNVGNVYFLMEDFDKSKAYYFEALQLKKQLTQEGFHQNIQKTLLNIGNVYSKLEDLDSAIYYFKKTEPFAQEAKDYKNLSLVYTDLGYAYSKKHQYEKANEFFEKALDIFNQSHYENDYDLSILLWTIAENELRRSHLKSAVTYGEQSLELSKSLENVNRMKDAYELLADIYEANGQLENALTAQKNFAIYKDSLLNIEKNKQIAELETKYETEKKDQALQLLNHDIELQKAANTRNTIIIIALIIILALLLFVFYQWKLRERSKHQQVLSEQKVRMREAQIKAIVNSEEKERKRFAADLHDSMGQLISALSLNIKSLQSQNGNHTTRDEVFENSMHILGDIQQEIRNIAFNLMPHILTKEGLVAAINELIYRLNKSQEIKADLQVFGLNHRLNEVYEISLYRIVQEWVSNIIKHGSAKSIFIQITAHDQEIVLTIEDDGAGFNPQDLEKSSGNGWKNINIRKNLINAELDIDSQQGRKNTMLTITFSKRTALKEQIVENTEY